MQKIDKINSLSDHIIQKKREARPVTGEASLGFLNIE